jgi:hypothetical protein
VVESTSFFSVSSRNWFSSDSIRKQTLDNAQLVCVSVLFAVKDTEMIEFVYANLATGMYDADTPAV